MSPHGSTRGIAATLVLVLALPLSGFAQPAAGTRVEGESQSVSVSATILVPRVLIEIELVIRNKTSENVRMDPGRFALVTDQGEQTRPLSAEQAKSLISSPGKSAWAFWWLGVIGY